MKKTARFAAQLNAPSTVALTSEGKLPELHLTEALSKSKHEAKRESNPVLLVVVFGVSILCTAMMLFYNPSADTTDKDTPDAARRALIPFYQEATGPAQPYQDLLRDSERAHARGDRKAEMNDYRHVLDLLHEEGRNQYKGLTGVPSKDRELERLLGTLLRTGED
ncbi:MAG TPA: hypothetical protein VFE24_14140 [Pirellulales bacterium]|nr:hypothetical protein [Pirellulales bacterium]